MLYGKLATMRRGAGVTSHIGKSMASASVSSNRPLAADNSEASTSGARRSFSIASTFVAPSSNRARVSPPGPGPISIVVPVRGAADRAIRRVRFRSNKKFCPSDLRARISIVPTRSRKDGKASISLLLISMSSDSGDVVPECAFMMRCQYGLMPCVVPV